MEKILVKAKSVFLNSLLILTGCWLAVALSFQLYGVYLMISNQEDRMTEISNEISVRIDGTFKNNPKNIWYEK